MVSFLHAERVSLSDNHRTLVNVCGQNVFSRKVLNDDPQTHGGRPRTSHTDENCVIVEVLLREIEESKFVKLLQCQVLQETLFMKSSQI